MTTTPATFEGALREVAHLRAVAEQLRDELSVVTAQKDALIDVWIGITDDLHDALTAAALNDTDTLNKLAAEYHHVLDQPEGDAS